MENYLRKRDKALELAMEKVAVFYYILYYIIGNSLDILPSLQDIGEGNFTEFTIGMMMVYMAVVNLSHWITCEGVDFFTRKEK